MHAISRFSAMGASFCRGCAAISQSFAPLTERIASFVRSFFRTSPLQSHFLSLQAKRPYREQIAVIKYAFLQLSPPISFSDLKEWSWLDALFTDEQGGFNRVSIANANAFIDTAMTARRTRIPVKGDLDHREKVEDLRGSEKRSSHGSSSQFHAEYREVHDPCRRIIEAASHDDIDNLLLCEVRRVVQLYLKEVKARIVIGYAIRKLDNALVGIEEMLQRTETEIQRIETEIRTPRDLH